MASVPWSPTKPTSANRSSSRAAKIVPGFERSETVMAPCAGVLTDPQIDSLILFIKSLK